MSSGGGRASNAAETNPWHRLVASAAGSVVAETSTLPTDVAKTRMQVSVARQYTGFVHCMRETARHEGVGALWKGLQPALVRQLCYTCTAMLLYEPIRNVMAPTRGSGDGASQSSTASFAQRLAAGGTAGALSITVFNPAEVLKTKMQSATTSRSMADVAAAVWRQRGIAGFWAGLGPNIARTFLVNAARLGTYDQAKDALIPVLGDGFWSFLGASAVAGFAAAAVSTPADVLKTRLMDQAGGRRLYTGMVDALVATVSQQGVAQLYAGFIPIFVRKLIFCSTFFVCYEEVLRRMQTD